MRVMALDLGVAHIGCAIMEDYSFGFWTPSSMALIETEADPRKSRIRAADSDMERVKDAMRRLDKMVLEHSIRRMAAELPPGGGKSAPAVKYMALASAIAAHLEVAHDLFVEWYSPGECKKSVAGYWTASKKEVAAVIEAKYPSVLAQFPTWERREHVVDALACFETARMIGNVCKL